MSELPKLTDRQREAAVERVGESIVLTSGAGCGKTLVLARRFTELIMQAAADGSIKNPFDRFVALTFTDKAAAEMARRVRTVLLERLRLSRDPDERRTLADWITELPAARICTIHSFCASLLRRHAVEAGVDPGFAVCGDELLAAQMRTRAVEDAVLEAVEQAQDDVLELSARTDLGRLVGDVKTLLQRRVAWQDEDYADPEATLGRWRQRQEDSRRSELERLAGNEKVRDELDYLADYPCDEPTDKLLNYREEKLAVIARILDEPDSVRREDIAALAEKAGSIGSQKAWGGKETLVSYRRELVAFVKQFAALADYFAPMGDADAEAAGCLAALTKLARDANERYMREKRAAGMLDFDDLMDLTARMLRDRPQVRKSLRDGLSQMLIDECQDVDAHQIRMLWGLLVDGQDLPAGKVVVIGDPKQSIYRFRGAQAEVFRNLCGRFGDARVVLDESFRAHRAGVSFVNDVFARMMGGDYEPIISSRTELPDGPSVEILLAECDDQTDADAAADAQADLLAWRIRQMIDGQEKLIFDREAGKWRPVRAGDIAVLFARMTKSLRYEYALQRQSLPYYVAGGVGFFRQQEIYDILNALRVIDNPFDDIALFGLLRSAVIGLDDNALLHVATALETSPPYFERLTDPSVLERLTESQADQLCFARELLGRLHRAKDALGPAAIIEKLLDETGYPAVLLSQFHGRRKLGNVLRLLDAARTTQKTGKITLSDFIRRYNELVMDQARHEQAAVVGETDDVVRLMTIHKAKGLEFPVVIIPDLNAAFGGPRDRILFNSDWSVTYKPAGNMEDNSEESSQRDKNGNTPLSYRLSKEAEKRALRDEDVRKLYVATTRHRDHLIFIGADRRNKDGRFREKDSYLSMLDDCLGIADALDSDGEKIAYGDGFSARVARIKPSSPVTCRRSEPVGLKIISAGADAQKVAEALAAVGESGEAAELNLVGSLTGSGSAAPIPTTTLVDFDHCPMLYRWRHELRVPARGTGGGTGACLPFGSEPHGRRPVGKVPPVDGGGQTRLNAATAGTMFHRCMELVDFDAVAGGSGAFIAQAGAIVARVIAEMELTVPPEPIERELAEMLNRLAGTALMKQLAQAKNRLTELSFVWRAGENMDITGQIDLLYQDADGAWGVVDYKSDRIGPDEVEARAKRYELQMMIYLSAARKHLGECVTGATVYFLRPGLEHRFDADPETLAAAERRLTHLAEELNRSRLTGQFNRIGDSDLSGCKSCPYASLCLSD